MEELVPHLLQGATHAAPLLLGTLLVHDSPEGRTSGRIVEVEAYHQGDPASHTFRGQTPRNASMFKSAGHLYVYFTYGMHWCANIVAGKEGSGEGILIRALEPLDGILLMQERRGTEKLTLLCSGPARAAQAMGISKIHDGTWLGNGPLRLEGVPNSQPYLSGPRIGISQGAHEPLRFWLPNSPHLSRR
ncbi:MAG TPA: DNA-3-methyladenine glycosylase [Verrucomicrobiae bacterium]|nr:DNA-3-methyladenine glycosylase [Verrucomicrobiae bacterium]